ncbi:hypothetical protein DFH08DRAFT_957473 [Mycena albidolilacea]|uniref:Uncharacterized protein n=1 Tax=Mycena albidolilacea TaxID=1033008 RepID=A0AAD7EVW5_9AGAR|nr:hypothetical protein DFH08DRAFT_957473 [Mycena albidolilacea]
MRYTASSPARIVREQAEHARVVREEEVQALRQKKARTARRAASEIEHSLALAGRACALSLPPTHGHHTTRPQFGGAIDLRAGPSSTRLTTGCERKAQREQLEAVFALLFGGRVEAKPEYKPRAAQSVDSEQPPLPLPRGFGTEAEQPTVSISANMQQPLKKKEAATLAPAPVCTFASAPPAPQPAFDLEPTLGAAGARRRFPAKWTSNSSWTPSLAAQLAARRLR